MGNTNSIRNHAPLHSMVRYRAWNDIGRFFQSASLEQKMFNLKYLNRLTLPDGSEDYSPVLSMAIAKKAPFAIIREMILVGGKEVVMMTDCKGNTPLHIACQLNPSPIIIHLLIDVGGRDLVVAKCYQKFTPLHFICNSGLTIKLRTKNGTLTSLRVNAGRSTDGHSLVEIVNRMVDAGGRDLVKAKDMQNQTSLMYACAGPDLPEQAILRMIQAGGKELLFMKNNKGMTAFHISMWNGGASPLILRTKVINEMIDVGGFDLVTAKAELDLTPLHVACSYGASYGLPLEVIQRIVDVGGVDLVLAKTSSGKRGLGVNALRLLIRYDSEKDWCIRAMKILVQTGGPKLILLKDDNGKTSIDALSKNTTDTILCEEKLPIRDEYIRFLEDAMQDGTTSTEENIPATAIPMLPYDCSVANFEGREELPVAGATFFALGP